jgi:hypothetical protein
MSVLETDTKIAAWEREREKAQRALYQCVFGEARLIVAYI